MNKKLILPIVLVLLVGIIVLVSAQMIETQVQIHKGWNLIFGFVEPEALSGKLEPNSIKAIYAFIPTTQQYARVYPNPENEKLQSIDDDYLRQTSFWVYSDSESATKLNDVMYADEYRIEEAPVLLSQHQLYKGWNFLAYIPEMQDKSLDDLKGNCNIEKAYIWKFDDKSDARGWVEMPTNGKFVGNSMLMMGFITKVTNDCTLGITNSGGENPPELPNNGNPTPTADCTDSDGGKDYYVKGISNKVYGPLGISSDTCLVRNPGSTESHGATECVAGEGCFVIELFCSQSKEYLEFEEYNCLKGCQDGACIQ